RSAIDAAARCQPLSDSVWFAHYLRALARFHRYSARNVMLILMQRPDATRVNAFWRWHELGRRVKKGEHGIRILAPLRQKVEAGTGGDDQETPAYAVRGFKTVCVFDIAQTEGAPLPVGPEAVPLEGESPVTPAAGRRLVAWLADRGVLIGRRRLGGG